MSKVKGKIVISALILALAGIMYWRFFSAPNILRQNFTVLFKVQENTTAGEIAKNLKKQNLIRSDTAFISLAKWRGLDTKIQPGKHQLHDGMNVSGILRALTDVNRPQISLTIPEGFSVQQIDKELAALGLIIEGGFVALAQQYEGFLFPDTYFIFSRDFDAADLIKKMQNNFVEKITPDMLEAVKKSGRTLEEIITMASILEREARREKDLAVVAGILWKRLENNWPLQADATLLYGRSSRIITKKDLADADNLYNTYTNLGLPPTPIGNPGLATIRAAIFPQESPYWFYLTDGEGNVHYSRTNEEHNEKRSMYNVPA